MTALRLLRVLDVPKGTPPRSQAARALSSRALALALYSTSRKGRGGVGRCGTTAHHGWKKGRCPGFVGGLGTVIRSSLLPSLPTVRPDGLLRRE